MRLREQCSRCCLSSPVPLALRPLAKRWFPPERRVTGSQEGPGAPRPAGPAAAGGSVTAPACSQLGSAGGRARPGRPAAPTLPLPPAPLPSAPSRAPTYLPRAAAGTGAGGPRARPGSCRPFSGRPGGARSRLLAHRRQVMPLAANGRPSLGTAPWGPGLGGGFPRGRPAAETATRAPGSGLRLPSARSALALPEPGQRVRVGPHSGACAQGNVHFSQ